MGKYEKVYEWASTAVLIFGVILTAFNIYPANIFVSMLGNFMWVGLGLAWKKWSLITIQIIVTVIYFFGLYKYFYVDFI